MNPTYQISYFGLLAERRGLSTETLSHPAIDVSALFEELNHTHQLGFTPSDLRAAINDEFVSWNQPINDGDRIAFLPPMSGG
jgi:molybdopterin converting factor small subunit